MDAPSDERLRVLVQTYAHNSEVHVMAEELLQLREQVTHLQTLSTQQLLAVRKGVWNTVERVYEESTQVAIPDVDLKWRRVEQFNLSYFRARLNQLLSQP